MLYKDRNIKLLNKQELDAEMIRYKAWKFMPSDIFSLKLYMS